MEPEFQNSLVKFSYVVYPAAETKQMSTSFVNKYKSV